MCNAPSLPVVLHVTNSTRCSEFCKHAPSPVTDASPTSVGGCVPYGKDVGNTLNDPTSGAQYRHSTVAATSALNCVGVTFQGQNVTLSISLFCTYMNTNGPHVGMVLYYCIGSCLSGVEPMRQLEPGDLPCQTERMVRVVTADDSEGVVWL